MLSQPGLRIAAMLLAALASQIPTGTAAAGGGRAAETCGNGKGVLLHPNRVTRDAAGARFYDYELDGVRMTSADAPPGFDATTASDAALERYGLPTRPTDGDDASWRRAMRAYRPKAATADHSVCLRPDLGETLCTTTTTNKCGNGAGRYGTLGNYTAVTANVTIPEMYAVNNCDQYGHLSSWVGMGVDGNAGGLLQAGTITELYPNQGMVNYAFYEWVGGTFGGPTVYPITSTWQAYPGDEMFERVQVNTSSHGVNFYVENVSTGQYLTMTVAGIYQDYDHRSAGWIVENHTRDLNQPNPKTGPWNWTNAKVTRYSTTTYGGSTQFPGTWTGVEGYEYHPNKGHIVENTNAWTSTTSFQTVWWQCRG